ncbi:MAG TPA: TonB-dependent receptor plug domain-containing protein [Allosphingosinicella sp.]
MRKTILLSALLAGTLASPALAQQLAPAAEPDPSPPAAAPEADPTATDTGAAAAEDPIRDEGEEEEIVVTGSRPRGSVIGDIPPEVTLDARDIRAYGTSSVAELLDAIAPQTRSGRGRGDERPVVLLNGRRISGFSEIRNLPPEAIQRVEILPEEVALKYGYRADQRVVNFVLRRRFRAITAEAEGGVATAGGRASARGNVNVLRIDRNGRWNVDAQYRHLDPLSESERDVIQATGGPSDPLVTSLARYRTLLGRNDQVTLNGTVNRTIFNDISATLNATLDAAEGQSFFGLPSATLTVPAESPFARSAEDEAVFRYFDIAPLARETESRNAHVGLAFNGDIRPWRWSATANYDRNYNESRTDTGLNATLAQQRIAAGDPALDPFGRVGSEFLTARANDRAQSITSIANAEFVANGSLFDLPAGDVSTTLKAGFERRDFNSETLRSGVFQQRDLSRNDTNAQANIDIPIASRRRAVLSAIGDLTLSLNAAVDRLSDFGTLRTLGAVVNWSPLRQVNLIASVTDEDGAPSMQQLGDPVVLTPNVRVFDFLRGETVDISRLEGGNPDLIADNRRVFKLGASIRPFEEDDLSITANYTKTRVRNPIASFPTATPEIEAAFPDRFERDEEGRLLRIDARPVNFERSDREELRWGFNFSKPIKSNPPPRPPGGWGGRGGWGGQGGGEGRQRREGGPGGGNAQPGQAGQGAPGAQAAAPESAQGQAGGGAQGGQGGWRGGGGGGGRGGWGGFGRGGRGQGGRIQLAFYHTWRFQDTVLIREGVPELDFLNGSAAGNLGGRPRHEFEVQTGIFRNGLGARLTANWQSGTTVHGGAIAGGGTASDLRFSSLATLNLRLFANLGEQAKLVDKHPWLRGTRVSLSIDNIFDTRLRVRDAAGVTPISYQPAYIDPLGRTVRITLRKVFF